MVFSRIVMIMTHRLFYVTMCAFLILTTCLILFTTAAVFVNDSALTSDTSKHPDEYTLMWVLGFILFLPGLHARYTYKIGTVKWLMFLVYFSIGAPTASNQFKSYLHRSTNYILWSIVFVCLLHSCVLLIFAWDYLIYKQKRNMCAFLVFTTCIVMCTAAAFILYYFIQFHSLLYMCVFFILTTCIVMCTADSFILYKIN